MPFYAQITDGIVTAITETAQAIDLPGLILVDSLDVGLLGKAYANGVFSQAPDTRPRHITGYAFKMRMTAAERIAIRTAAAASPAVADFMDLADSAQYIDLDLSTTRDGVEALEAAALIGVGRAAVILDTAITDAERP